MAERVMEHRWQDCLKSRIVSFHNRTPDTAVVQFSRGLSDFDRCDEALEKYLEGLPKSVPLRCGSKVNVFTGSGTTRNSTVYEVQMADFQCSFGAAGIGRTYHNRTVPVVYCSFTGNATLRQAAIHPCLVRPPLQGHVDAPLLLPRSKGAALNRIISQCFELSRGSCVQTVDGLIRVVMWNDWNFNVLTDDNNFAFGYSKVAKTNVLALGSLDEGPWARFLCSDNRCLHPISTDAHSNSVASVSCSATNSSYRHEENEHDDDGFGEGGGGEENEENEQGDGSFGDGDQEDRNRDDDGKGDGAGGDGEDAGGDGGEDGGEGASEDGDEDNGEDDGENDGEDDSENDGEDAGDGEEESEEEGEHEGAADRDREEQLVRPSGDTVDDRETGGSGGEAHGRTDSNGGTGNGDTEADIERAAPSYLCDPHHHRCCAVVQTAARHAEGDCRLPTSEPHPPFDWTPCGLHKCCRSVASYRERRQAEQAVNDEPRAAEPARNAVADDIVVRVRKDTESIVLGMKEELREYIATQVQQAVAAATPPAVPAPLPAAPLLPVPATLPSPPPAAPPLLPVPATLPSPPPAAVSSSSASLPPPTTPVAAAMVVALVNTTPAGMAPGEDGRNGNGLGMDISGEGATADVNDDTTKDDTNKDEATPPGGTTNTTDRKRAAGSVSLAERTKRPRREETATKPKIVTDGAVVRRIWGDGLPVEVKFPAGETLTTLGSVQSFGASGEAPTADAHPLEWMHHCRKFCSKAIISFVQTPVTGLIFSAPLNFSPCRSVSELQMRQPPPLSNAIREWACKFKLSDAKGSANAVEGARLMVQSWSLLMAKNKKKIPP